MGIKLLLADDSITIQKVVGIIFASEDYDVTIVDNGTAALAKARELKPDVLLVDAVMPGKSGYEVCEEIRNDPVLQRVPILLLTGAFEAFDEERAKKSGADDIISKPFESQTLIDKVTSLIEAGKQRKSSLPPSAPAVSALSPVIPPAIHQPVPPPQQPAAATFGVAPGRPEGSINQPVSSDASHFTVEVVEGTADDDLWGAFDLEELTDDTGDVTEIPSASEEDSFVTEMIDEPFSFAENDATAIQPESSAVQWAIPAETGFDAETDVFEVVPEGDFGAFEEESGSASFGMPSAADDFFIEEMPQTASQPATLEEFDVFGEEPASFFEEDLPEQPAERFQHAIPPPPADKELKFASEEQYVPMTESAPAAFDAAPSPPLPGELTLNEGQLAALVSRISRDILEKIAWEVVPDLAETIIREEIRKIKGEM